MKKSLKKFNQDEVLLSNQNLRVIKGGGCPEDEPESEVTATD